MSRPLFPQWLLLALLPFGFVLLILSLWIFRSLTAKPLYPDPYTVPSVAGTMSSAIWDEAVKASREIVRKQVAEQNLPGVSIAVGIQDSLIWAEGFGFADIRTSEEVTPKHRFRIGTASSALTSAAAGLLMEKGQLRLDEEIQTHVPQFPHQQWPVSFRQVMGHTAGVIPESSNREQLFSSPCRETGEAISLFASQPLLFRPGTKFHKSANDWVLVSAAIEAAAGQPFLTFMNKQIFDPLGMQDTVVDPGPDRALIDGEDFPGFILIRELIHDPDATRNEEASRSKKLTPGQVQSYFPRFRSNPKYGFHMMRLQYLSCYAGSAAFTSTPSDLVRFGMALRKGHLLKAETVDLLQTSQKLTSGEETGYGLDWSVKSVNFTDKQVRMIGHDGYWSGGMVASLLMFPDSGVVIAVTSNIPFSDTFTIGMKIAEAFATHSK